MHLRLTLMFSPPSWCSFQFGQQRSSSLKALAHLQSFSCTVESRSRSKFWHCGNRQQARPRDETTALLSFAWI
jgi:hypothetical protein